MKKLQLANVPTRIDPLKHSPQGTKLWIKRDDQTGTELSGNKIRKLEYALHEAKERSADVIVTCGGIQSNHARTTAAACRLLDLDCILLLKEDSEERLTGNYFLDGLLGAEIIWLDEESYTKHLIEKKDELFDALKRKGRTPYFMPVGASNGIGTFGYYEAYGEILAQEKALDVFFDAVVVTVGSGGTYAGLCFANQEQEIQKRIIGIPILKDAAWFEDVVRDLHEEFLVYHPEAAPFDPSSVLLIDGFTGPGYAKNTPEDLAFIKRFAGDEGIVLDPVYTGKAMRGLFSSLETGHPALQDAKNILFIHTGGLLGIFGKEDRFTLS